jgi:hypothetical protein
LAAAAAEAAFLDAWERGRLHHAWLIAGPEGIGKATLAYRFARRLLAAGAALPGQPFRLVQELPRRGLVAGLYLADASVPGGVAELSAPRLYAADHAFVESCHPALPVLPDDVAELVAISRAREAAALLAPWAPVLPIYPTSPVQGG